MHRQAQHLCGDVIRYRAAHPGGVTGVERLAVHRQRVVHGSPNPLPAQKGHHGLPVCGGEFPGDCGHILVEDMGASRPDDRRLQPKCIQMSGVVGSIRLLFRFIASSFLSWTRPMAAPMEVIR